MRLQRIACRGFISYDDLDLDLSEIDIAAIVGKVGAGKSSLFTAVTWCLWGAIDRRTGVIGDTFDECMVQVEFQTKGTDWRVIRTAHTSGRGSTLTLTEMGHEEVVGDNHVLKSEHTIAQTQAEINRVIGLDFKSLSAGPFMVQEKHDTFMTLAPGPRKDLLITLFGVEVYEKYREAAAVKASEYAREADAASYQLVNLDDILETGPAADAEARQARYDLALKKQEREAVEKALEAAKERQIALREQARHVQTMQQTVTMLSERITADKKEHERMLRQISDAHTAKDAPQPAFGPLDPIDEGGIEKAKALAGRYRTATDERRGLEAQLPLVEEQLARLLRQQEIVKTVPCGGEGIYATCRFLTSAPSAEDIVAQGDQINRITERLKVLPTVRETEQVEDRYNALVSGRTAYDREMLRRETALAQWQLRVESAEQVVKNGQDGLLRLETQVTRDQGLLNRTAQQLASMSADQSAIESVADAIESARFQLEEVTQSIDIVYQPAVARAEERLRQIEEAKAERGVVAKSYKEAKAKADVYGLLVTAFHRDGIPTMILENGIPLIEERANEVLARMPEPRQVKILTQRSNKRGGLMERIDVVVQRGGRQRDYNDLSGGERFRVSFALRIGIGHVLAHRAGATIETLFLDEGWGSQDEDGVEALLESLAAVQREFGIILIISHQQAVIDRFQKRIEVARPEDGFSSVTIAA